MEFKDPVTRDGFHVLRDRFSPPADSVELAPDTKRKITICNLFLNYKLSIKEVAKTLDETQKRVISVLIEQGFIRERRGINRQEEAPRPKQGSLFVSRLKKSGV